MMKKTVAAASAVLLTAGLGVGLSQLANADVPTPSATSTPTAGPDASGRPDQPGQSGRQDKGPRGHAKLDASALAGKLGVDETKLSEAVASARKATGSAERTKPAEGTKPTQADRDAERAAFGKALASELGIDEAKVTAALDELRAERDAARAERSQAVLDQAVKDGTLTQVEADAVKKAVDAGVVQLGRGGPRR